MPKCPIVQVIENLVAGCGWRRLTSTDDEPIFCDPFVGFADGDDPLFSEYKRIIGDFHFTPREIPKKHFPEWDGQDDSCRVICWVLPISEQIRKSNATQSTYPSEKIWESLGELPFLRLRGMWDMHREMSSWSNRWERTQQEKMQGILQRSLCWLRARELWDRNKLLWSLSDRCSLWVRDTKKALVQFLRKPASYRRNWLRQLFRFSAEEEIEASLLQTIKNLSYTFTFSRGYCIV